MIKSLLNLIGPRRKRQMLALIPAMLLASLLEMAGLTMVVSVCASIADSSWMDGNSAVLWLRDALHIRSETSMTSIMLIALIVLYAFKLPYLSWENYMVTKFVRTTQHELSTRLCGYIIRSPYPFFIRHSTAELQNLLGNDMILISGGLNSCMQIFMEAIVALGMVICLLLIDPVMTLFLSVGIVSLIFLTRVILKRIIGRASQRQREANRRRWKWLHHIVEGIKDIKTGRHEAYFESRFTEASEAYTHSEYLKQFWVRLPTLCIESIMILTVLLYLLFLVRTGRQLIDFLPGLSALAWAAVRLLPAFSRINTGLTQISYSKPSVTAVCRAIEEMTVKEDESHHARPEIDISGGIMLDHVSYSYDGAARPVLSDVSMDIPAGSSVGIIGPSGAGKTTLLDILLGLLAPDKGNVLIDGVPIDGCYGNVLKRIAYVPQVTFLLDDTIRSNVTMGLDQEQIEDKRIWEALEKAALSDKVHSLPDGLDTRIGERGIRLSGGERQRLGLARAIYRDPSLIVFDEATSGLDLKTEAAVMESIGRLKGTKTLVIVSHRASAIAGCDHIYRVENGKVYEER